jgi:hypothetical protein
LRRCRLRRQQHKQGGEQVRGELHRSLYRPACPFARSLPSDLRASVAPASSTCKAAQTAIGCQQPRHQ